MIAIIDIIRQLPTGRVPVRVSLVFPSRFQKHKSIQIMYVRFVTLGSYLWHKFSIVISTFAYVRVYLLVYHTINLITRTLRSYIN